MTHLHLDLVGGIAGDMTVAALLDLGIPLDELRARLLRSGLPSSDVSAAREWKGGMAGTTFSVAPETKAPHRTWQIIRALLDEADLAPRARERALDAFHRLAVAEAHVHGCAVDDVHFHEVGAMDSIVDIVSAAILLDLHDATSFSCSRVPVCEGTVSAAHGVMPLPAPATARLLVGFELLPVPGTLETVTPTGAALLASLCDGHARPLPRMTLTGTGAGLGTAELPDRPNILRVLAGVLASRDEPRRADAVVIEASIDDMDPRLYGQVAEDLFAAGALDVSLAALQMKKGRPGTLLSVLCRPELEGVLTTIVLRGTTTLGVRSHDVRRTELERRFVTVPTTYGDVRLKLGLLGGELVNASPEYEDCARAARAHGVPVKEVLAAALAAGTPHGAGTPRAKDDAPR